jgi:GGDEF domain-containing protein
MIRLLAKVCTEHCESERDFLGHVGGDDFIMLFQSANWLDRCQSIVSEFNTYALGMFDESARSAGGIHGEDRQGLPQFFPCTTLSIGATAIPGGRFTRAEDIANLAALAKHDAKRAGTGVCLKTIEEK